MGVEKSQREKEGGWEGKREFVSGVCVLVIFVVSKSTQVPTTTENVVPTDVWFGLIKSDGDSVVKVLFPTTDFGLTPWSSTVVVVPVKFGGKLRYRPSPVVEGRTDTVILTEEVRS